jgi:hypothetical protein
MSHERMSPLLPIGAALALGFGATLLALGLLTMRDLEQMRRAPEVIWAALCGVPQADDVVTVPLLLGGGTVGVTVGAILIALTARSGAAV